MGLVFVFLGELGALDGEIGFREPLVNPDSPSSFYEALDETSLADNSMEIVKIQGRKIAIAKRYGKIYAIDNECPHVGGALGWGTFYGNSVVCPLHQWTFDLTTGKATKGISGDRVAVYEVKVENGKIWVKFPASQT
jgi:nitrite reductase/ring-hydroxylating ferredoxin subunit